MVAVITTVPQVFACYVDAAIIRFSYLCPNIDIKRDGLEIQFSGNDFEPDQARQEFFHLLYRERIYTETLELRKAVYHSIA